MTSPEEVEQLKIKLENTTDEREQAEILLEILNKYESFNITGSQSYIDRLLQLAEKLSEPLYQAWGLYYQALLKINVGEYIDGIYLMQQTINLFEKSNNRSGIARCYNNLGLVYLYQCNYSEALKNYTASLNMRKEIGDKKGAGAAYNNTGNVYLKQGNYSDALKNFFSALEINKELKNKRGMGFNYNNIGHTFHKQGNHSEALKNHFASLQIKTETGDKKGIAMSYFNIGSVHADQGNYDIALENHSLSLQISQETNDKRRISHSYGHFGIIYYEQGNYPDALKNHFASLKLSEELQSEEEIAASLCNIGNVYQKQGNYPEALKYTLSAIELADKIGHKEFIRNIASSLTNIYKATHDFENALKYHEKYHLVDSEMLGEQAQRQFTNLSFTHNLEQKEKDLEIEQLRNVELKKERDRSESLLLNILPAEVAEELKEKGEAEAKQIDEVTVLFTDFKGFTTMTEKLTPKQLVKDIHECFSAFDHIMEKYGMEKIKTIGDSYMAAGGLPTPNKTHATDAVNAAIKIREFIAEGKARKVANGEPYFEIRIGIHTGPVVAGIVGVKKFAYDIWGDTVNIASRMESSGEVGQINISEATYDLVKDKFTCEYRGEIEAKNKGKMKMYFVEVKINSSQQTN